MHTWMHAHNAPLLQPITERTRPEGGLWLKVSLCTGVNKQQFAADDFVPLCMMEVWECGGGLIADMAGDSCYDLQFAGENRRDGSNPENLCLWQSADVRGTFWLDCVSSVPLAAHSRRRHRDAAKHKALTLSLQMLLVAQVAKLVVHLLKHFCLNPLSRDIQFLTAPNKTLLTTTDSSITALLKSNPCNYNNNNKSEHFCSSFRNIWFYIKTKRNANQRLTASGFVVD